MLCIKYLRSWRGPLTWSWLQTPSLLKCPKPSCTCRRTASPPPLRCSRAVGVPDWPRAVLGAPPRSQGATGDPSVRSALRRSPPLLQAPTWTDCYIRVYFTACINQFPSARLQVSELKERLRPMRGFWVSLPHTICNDKNMAADVTNEDRCWNGQTRGRYLPDVTGDGLMSQINNPEVEVDMARPDVRTRQLIMELRVATNRLKHAQAGQDTDFMDSEVEEGSGSGGGGERYSDDWPGYRPYSPPYSKPPLNPQTPIKPPRVRDRTGSKWNRSKGRSISAVSRPAFFSLAVLFWLSVMVTVAPMWR
ncbi:glypican-1 [Salmo trutta]|uniref:glypican-1 n=1 Tax=Salmo trutta TaxID=8032 RepID=UPI001130BF6E|nr:glypican-1-like [Salmo trutta]